MKRLERRFMLILLVLSANLTTGRTMGEEGGRNTIRTVTLRQMSQTPVTGAEEARSLLFDHNGMMWVGTDQGLRAYDGYRFKTYRNQAYSPGILPNNYVNDITEDHEGRLWIGTRDGLVCFDRRHATFRTYHLQGEGGQSINVLFTSSDGTVWAGTSNGVSRYDAKTDDFIAINMTTGIRSFAEDSKGNIYIGTWAEGLFRLDRKGCQLISYPPMSGRNTVQSMCFDHQGRLWIGTWENGIIRIDNPEDVDQLSIHRINDGRQDFRTFHDLVEDSVSHSIWGCCIEGLTRVDVEDTSQAENYPELSFCYDMETDGHGNLWVLTRNQGIVHMSTKPTPFRFCHLDPAGLVLPVNRIQTVFTNDGNRFWLSLQPYGLACYNRSTGQVTYNNDIPGFREMNGNEGIAVQTISSILQCKNGELWMGGTHGIIVWKEGEQARLLPRVRTPFIGNLSVNALYQLPNGIILTGLDSGLGIALSETKGHMLRMNEDGRDFSSCNVRHITTDHSGQLWVATENAGIIRISTEGIQTGNAVFHQYAPVNNNYPIDNATAVYEDAARRLWAISSSGGLFLYNRENDRFTPVNHRVHLNVASIYAIEGDSDGWIWLSTNQGIIRLKPTEEEWLTTYFGVEDGIESIRFSSNGSCHYASELFFGSANGFFSFYPSRMTHWQQANTASVVVTDLLIDDQSYDWLKQDLQRTISDVHPSSTQEITIPSRFKKFSVTFALLEYQKPLQCVYAYQLKGYDHDWHYTDAESRTATYQNLPAGTYQLALRVTDSYGRMIDLPYTIRVRVLPPWFLTWWAYLIYIILLAASVYGIVQWYRNYLKTKNRLAMSVVFTNITHELLTPLTVISASIDDLRTKSPQYSENYSLMQNNILRLTRLLRQILEVRKSQAGQLKLLVSYSNLADFVSKECENIRPMFAGKKGSLTVDCPPSLDAWFDKDKVDKILYNLLSNAIKYNKEGGRVSVSLTAADDGTAVLKVSDEGIGISREKMKHLYARFLDGDYRRMNTTGTGIGLSLTHDLVVLHHGHIDCQSQEGKGTTFSVTLPIERNRYADQEIDFTADNKTIDAQLIENTDFTEDIQLTEDESKDYSVLIVEDNVELLELMRRLFTQKYNVYTACNGQKALNIIQRRDLDLVVTDVMMPIMDGIELTRTIKSSADYGQLPVIMLTAKTTDEDQNLGYETGADAYITKPFKLPDLELRINNIISNRERVRRKFSSQTEFKVEEQHYSSPDEVFISKAVDCVKAHLDDGDYDREQFARDMLVSSSTLYNKLRALTGQNVTGFINSIRLKEACRIARQRPDISVSELSLEVGFNTPKYFTKCFKKEFGCLPSEFLEKKD